MSIFPKIYIQSQNSNSNHFLRRTQNTILKISCTKTTLKVESQHGTVKNSYQFFINCYELHVSSLVLCQPPCGTAQQSAVQDFKLKNDLCNEKRGRQILHKQATLIMSYKTNRIERRRGHKNPFSLQLVLSAEFLADSHLTLHNSYTLCL